MKVLFVQPYVSFAGVVSDTLPGQLARRGHDVIVLTYVRDKERANRLLKEENLHLDFADAISISIPNLVTEFPYFLFLEKEIERAQPDIIHINNLMFLTTLQSVRIATRLHKKSVIHVHGVLGDRGSLLNFAQRAYIHVIGRSVFSKADRTICLTIDDASMINRLHCPWEKISVIPNGVDVNEFRPLDNETPSSLLWCGRFVHEKGLEYLVEALRIIVTEKKRRSIKLTMVGDGPLLPKIHELVERNGLDENVRFVGDLPHERIPTLMSEASVYVLPSLHEGMPYTLLEAMACGKPVIGSNIPGINDVIAHDRNGILVPAEDPKELACAIEKLLDDRKLRRDLGRNARQLVVMKYGWDTIVSRIERLYCEVAAGE